MIYAGICISWSGGNEFSMIYEKSFHIMEGELEIFHGIGKNSHIMEGELEIFHGIGKNSHIMEGDCQSHP